MVEALIFGSVLAVACFLYYILGVLEDIKCLLEKIAGEEKKEEEDGRIEG